MEHTCLDCGDVVVRKGDVGFYPRRCPDCQAVRRKEQNRRWYAEHKDWNADKARRREAKKREERYGDPAPRRRPARTCKVVGCNNPTVTRDDLCATHRRKKRLYGAEDGSFATHKQCAWPGCEANARPAWKRPSDYCAEHLVDYVRREVAEGRSRGAVQRNGYVYSQVWKRNYADHRLVMEYLLGRPLLPDETPHHINGDRTDNRPQNLELWSSAQPAGQRVEDKVAWAREIIARYGDQFVQPRLLIGS